MAERTLDEALAYAERLRVEIPQLIQPEPSAFYVVLLADEILRLREDLDRIRPPYSSDICLIPF